ncbi:MAG: VRR-NUC domain-containing protein [Thermomicrobiales bacterium]
MTDAIFAGNAPAHQDNLTEGEFQNQIVSMANALGWTMRFHNVYAIGSDRGYPDLTLVHPVKGVVWIEVKGPKPNIYQRQVEWLETLQEAGQAAYLVYPEDYDAVARLLQRGEAGSGDHAKLIDNQYRYKAQPFRKQKRMR